MARTCKQLEAAKARRIDIATVRVGDRVRHSARSVGTVVAVSANPAIGYGSILWDGDAAPVESAMRFWKWLERV